MVIARAALCAWVLAASAAFSAETSNTVISLARETAPASLRVKPGFRVELVASEPLVASPVALAFDENGRLFVAEMRETSERPGLGRIRLLEQPDERGVFQHSTVFAEELPWPAAVACYAGGVFVAAGTEIHYLKDTKGIGKADLSQVVLAGFGGTNTPSAAAMVNSFQWGLDNYIHGAAAGLGGLITASNWPGEPVILGRSDFAFDPRTLAAIPEAGPAYSGLSFDALGRKFTCDAGRPLRLAMFEPRYTTRNPFFASPPELVDVASPATVIYRAVKAYGTNASTSGWLTDARGLLIYRGSAFPTQYLGSAFICAPNAHLVHHEVVRASGLSATAERAADERTSEFLVSSESDFRPAQCVTGPDGALYIADQQDGGERGRIYRVVPETFRHSKPPQLGQAKTYDLVSALASANSWHGDTAARLLVERREPTALPLLGEMLNNSRSAAARVRALNTLASLEGLKEAQVVKSLHDLDAGVREHAVRLAGRFANNGAVSDKLWDALRPLTADASVRVRRQLAFTLGDIRRPERERALAEIVSRDLGNPWMEGAVLSSLADGAGSMLVLLAGDARFSSQAAGFDFLRRLAEMVGTKGRLDEVAQAAGFLAQAPIDRLTAMASLVAVGEGLHRTRSSLALVDTQGALQPVYLLARNTAIDNMASEPARVAAVRLLAVSPYTFEEIGDWLLALSNPQPFFALRSAAIKALGRYDDPAMTKGLLDEWAALTPPLRTVALSVLVSRTSRAAAALDAVEKGIIAPADWSSPQLNFLRTHPEPAISQRALRLFGPVRQSRTQVRDQFQSTFRRRGAADRGREYFRARCAECHQATSASPALGPDLSGARTRGKEALLAAILEPSAEVRPDYATVVLEASDGEMLAGRLADGNQATVTFQQPGSAPTIWPRLNVKSLRTQNWSLMPDGLEQGFSDQDMADLLEYLVTARPGEK